MPLTGLPGGISPDALNQLMGQSRGAWSSPNPAMQNDVSEWTQLAQLLGYTADPFPKMGTAGQDEARFLNTMKSIMDQQLGAFGEGTQINQLPGSMQQMFQMFAPLMTSPGATRSVAPVGTAGMMSGGYKSGPLPTAMSPMIQMALSQMQQNSPNAAAPPANQNPAMAALPTGDPAAAAPNPALPAPAAPNQVSTGVQTDADLARYGPEGQQSQNDPATQSIAAALAARQAAPSFIQGAMDNPAGAIPGVNAGPSGEPATGANGNNIAAVLSNLMHNPQMSSIAPNPTSQLEMVLRSMGQGGMGNIIPGIQLIQQLQRMSQGGGNPTPNAQQYVDRPQNGRRAS